MKVLALDVSTTTTGFAIMDSHLKLIEYGQFSIKNRELSDTMYAVGITDKSIKLAEKYNVDNIVIENIFYAKNPHYFRRWARVHGALALEWYKKTKKEPTFIMAIEARPKVGLSGQAKKIEIQLEMSYRYKLIGKTTYYKYLKIFNEFTDQKKKDIEQIKKDIKSKTEQKKLKKKINSKYKYAVAKLSKAFEKDNKISEHEVDSIVLGIAYFK